MNYLAKLCDGRKVFCRRKGSIMCLLVNFRLFAYSDLCCVDLYCRGGMLIFAKFSNEGYE